MNKNTQTDCQQCFLISKGSKVINALSIDVEDYWAIFNRDWLGVHVEPTDAVVRNTEWLLEKLNEYGMKATFFILGEVAETFPFLVRRIFDLGHEIASHGISHKQIFKLNKEEFRKDASDSKRVLEDIISSRIYGFRAPAFSITPKTEWALAILAEVGFEYDSSIFPISASRRYGWPKFCRKICKLDLPSGNSIVEVPLSTVKVLGKSFPVGGGGYIRHLPYTYTKWGLRCVQRHRAAIVYLHPYEIDTKAVEYATIHLDNEQKNTAIRFHRFQLRNRNTMKRKINRMLSEFQFATIREVVNFSLA